MNPVSVVPQNPPVPSCQPLLSDDTITCEVCGVAGAFAIADRQLCDVCYQNCGACCQGEDEEGEIRNNGN